MEETVAVAMAAVTVRVAVDTVWEREVEARGEAR